LEAWVLEKLYKRSSLTASDLPSFQRQETVFIVLNLGLLAALLFLHTMFTAYLGRPSRALIIVFSATFLVNVVELIWVQTLTRELAGNVLGMLTWSSISLGLAAAGLLTALTNHEDSPYFAVAVVPVLIAAFRLSLPSVVGVAAAATVLNLGCVEYFFRAHPPADPGEYFEAGINSLIFALVGLLVWLLVNQIRENESNLARNLLELKQARAKLLEEETLAAVGRLSSAIAHEIRNPVAMIASSLTMAKQSELGSQQHGEMCEIAAREAVRLEKLTTDFLNYARPRKPETSPNLIHDTLAYVASVCRAHAGDKDVEIEVDAPESLEAELDPAQIQQALLNLVMNAIDASPKGGTVRLKSDWDGFSEVCVWVSNNGTPIAQAVEARIFEPFFTTKPRGTGLGLAIARNIARSHGGDLSISSNQPNNVSFCLRLPAARAEAAITTKD
jgi:two-component system sensor histidine kinase HydH